MPWQTADPNSGRSRIKRMREERRRIQQRNELERQLSVAEARRDQLDVVIEHFRRRIAGR